MTASSTSHVAIIDATGHRASVPLDLDVASLSALERSLRLAEISGCQRARVFVSPDLVARSRELIEETYADLEISLHDTSVDSTRALLREWSDTITDHLQDDAETILYLRSTTAYFRNLPGACREHVHTHGGLAFFESEEGTMGDVMAFDARGWSEMRGALEEAPSDLEQLEAFVDWIQRHRHESATSLQPDRAWQMRMHGPEDADRAGDRIWQDCRKPTDGPVSTHLNRRVTLPISRRLGALDLSPNLVSCLAFFVGLAAGWAGTWGGYAGFLAAGALYQLNSLADGFDGELARGKYEFTDLGAWIDKFCDDTADLFFVSGVGYGAYATGVSAPLGGDEFWLLVVGIYLFGKTLCSSAFYAIPFLEGELVHPYGFFDWWFEEEKDQKAKDGFWAQLFGGLKVLTKNDVFVMIAFLFAVAGRLPWFLVIFAVGQVGVGVSRIFQVRDQLARNRAESSSTSSSSPASAGGE